MSIQIGNSDDYFTSISPYYPCVTTSTKSTTTPPTHTTLSTSNLITIGSETDTVTINDTTHGNIAIGSTATGYSFIGGGQDNIFIDGGSNNIAIGVSAGKSSFISGNYSFPATYSTVTTLNIESNEKIEIMEKKIKDLETKLERLLEMITDDKISLKISI